jgi:hypothetical protein
VSDNLLHKYQTAYLPLARLAVVVDMHDAERDKARNDLRDAIALKGPAEPLRDLDASVEHGNEDHDARSDRAFGCAEEEAQRDC